MDGPVCCVSRILQAHLIISPVAAASFSVSFSMSASVRVSAADRKAARALLLALSDFSTASDALTRLFGGLADAPAAACERRFCVAAQLLRWQNLPAAAVSLADALVDFAAGDADDGGDREVVVTRGMVLTAMGKPALLFATSIYDDALAELVWAGLLALRRRLGAALDLARHALDNASDAHGYSALHYALEAQMHALALRVWRDLAQASSDQAGEHEAGTGSATNAVARLAASVVTQDVALPAGKKQIQGRNVSSGGATLLHFAARVDAPEELVRALLEGSPPAVAAAEDWDGNSPYRVALMRGNRFLADLLRVRPLACRPRCPRTPTNALHAASATLWRASRGRRGLGRGGGRAASRARRASACALCEQHGPERRLPRAARIPGAVVARRVRTRTA